MQSCSVNILQTTDCVTIQVMSKGGYEVYHEFSSEYAEVLIFVLLFVQIYVMACVFPSIEMTSSKIASLDHGMELWLKIFIERNIYGIFVYSIL